MLDASNALLFSILVMRSLCSLRRGTAHRKIIPGGFFPLTYLGRFVVLRHGEKFTGVNCFLCTLANLNECQSMKPMSYTLGRSSHLSLAWACEFHPLLTHELQDRKCFVAPPSNVGTQNFRQDCIPTPYQRLTGE